LLAARVGSVLNLNEVSKKCGISFPTAKRWLSLLEATQIIYLLRPYYKNISKRVIKSPKLYFYDTGLLAYILKYQSSETLQSGPLAGNFFENLIIIELLKKKVNKGYNYALYYFRDSNKNEIDVIIEYNGTLQLIEIKMAKTIKKAFTITLKKIAPLIPNSRMSIVSFDRNNIPPAKDISSDFWYDFITNFIE
jgi:predicted AAA+ superfamily ATPase